MTAFSAPEVATGAVPIAFMAAGAWCFGWFHPARLPARKVGVVLCSPIGYEAICAHQTYTQLADALAEAGFAVVRFDYHGTGDSSGGDADPDRVRAWMDSITSAINELKRLGDVSHVALFGVRLGATLAAHAASQLGGIESLVMWAPCITGRSFARELRAASGNRPMSARPAAPGDIEALGYLYTAQTLQDLQALDCQCLDRPLAQRVLILGRDDMPGEGPLPAKYREIGMDTSYAVMRGYSGMMTEPHEAVPEPATLNLITDWLSAVHPLPDTLQEATSTAAPGPIDYLVDGIRETPQLFGLDRSLFGILSESAELKSSDSRLETAILMLNVGRNHHIGPNRMYVKTARSLAASGYRTFRFDLAGIGDSRPRAGLSSGGIYSKDSIADVQAAIDSLVAQGCKKFYLMGICSGSYVAFQTALVDPRVTGQILMNSRLLEWHDGKAGGTWQSSMQMYYKSSDFYRRALLRPDLYRRILRGEVDVNGIARRLRTVFKARLARAFNRFLHRTPAEEGVLDKVKNLSARGTDTVLIMSADDDGRDYVEFQFGRLGSRMQGNPNFRMVLVEESDHTFSDSESQRFVIDTVQEHLKKRVSKMG
ncbi:MAG: alpha/beta fold hydrolase [Polaromonas sp.]|uniref:alpha/beta fold hydrolase n=1 Tax=Polaromonas sp. TaxID=1869339 RepID=UPI00185C4964|nr:alpha/beta fold hydrolase [Polaromonas sp.]NMM09539.1 alpha/beta fold hydrolase [Polaromonas sp.]